MRIQFLENLKNLSLDISTGDFLSGVDTRSPSLSFELRIRSVSNTKPVAVARLELTFPCPFLA